MQQSRVENGGKSSDEVYGRQFQVTGILTGLFGLATSSFGVALEKKIAETDGLFTFVDRTQKAIDLTTRLHLAPWGAPFIPEVTALSIIGVGLFAIAFGMLVYNGGTQLREQTITS